MCFDGLIDGLMANWWLSLIGCGIEFQIDSQPVRYQIPTLGNVVHTQVPTSTI